MLLDNAYCYQHCMFNYYPPKWSPVKLIYLYYGKNPLTDTRIPFV